MFHFCEFQGQPPFQGESNIIFRGRMVWRDLATWIRAYLVYVYLESDPELQQIVVDKLLAIPQDYGNMFRLFFGDTIAEEYTVLLTDYVMLFINLINAQKNGDVEEVDEYTKQLYQNADLRADFLSTINPFWQKNVLQSLIHNFTSMTIDESTTFYTKEYKRNIELFDRILSYTSVMGDYLAQGITNYLQYSSRQPMPPR